MAMNIVKVKRHRTVALEPYGRLPISDSPVDAKVKLDEEHLKRGKRNRPNACAIALGARDSADNFPGRPIAWWVYKSYTLCVTRTAKSNTGMLRVLRFVHDTQTRKAINGFDKSSEPPGSTLRAGDVIVLHAPKGYHKLGNSNGASNNAPVKRKRPTPECHKRGVFVEESDARAAAADIGNNNIVH